MSKDRTPGSIGILGILGLIFITLKLTGYINWSWWWVTLPFWGIGVFMLTIVVVFIVIALFAKGSK